MAERIKPPSALSYVECDLPPGMTIAEYRRQRALRRRASRRVLLWHRRRARR